MKPDGLERLLKGLEGHVVNSVDISREEGFLHVKLSVIELDPQYTLARHEILGGPKELKFSVMWKKTLDGMLERYKIQLDEILSNLKGTSSELGELGETLEDLKENLR